MQLCFLILPQGFPGCSHLLVLFGVHNIILLSYWEAEIISVNLHSEDCGLVVMNLQFKMSFSPFLGLSQ